MKLRIPYNAKYVSTFIESDKLVYLMDTEYKLLIQPDMNHFKQPKPVNPDFKGFNDSCVTRIHLFKNTLTSATSPYMSTMIGGINPSDWPNQPQPKNKPVNVVVVFSANDHTTLVLSPEHYKLLNPYMSLETKPVRVKKFAPKRPISKLEASIFMLSGEHFQAYVAIVPSN